MLLASCLFLLNLGVLLQCPVGTLQDSWITTYEHLRSFLVALELPVEPGTGHDSELTTMRLVISTAMTYRQVHCNGWYVLNALEAICTGIHFGITAEEALQALEDYRVVGMRQEEEIIGGVTLVKDTRQLLPIDPAIRKNAPSFPTGRQWAIPVLVRTHPSMAMVFFSGSFAFASFFGMRSVSTPCSSFALISSSVISSPT